METETVREPQSKTPGNLFHDLFHDEQSDVFQRAGMSGEDLEYEIEQEIDGFFHTNFEEIDLEIGILDSFWHRRKNDYPMLYEVYMLISSVPGTQVSVERLFSHLKFILSDQRSALAGTILDAILFVR